MPELYGFRVLRKSPRFSWTVVTVLALGIGICSTMFTLVNAVVLRPLPFANPDRLVVISQSNSGKGLVQQQLAPPEVAEVLSMAGVFVDAVPFRRWAFNLTGRDEPERLVGVIAAPRFFDLLGVRPALGRGFRAEDATPGNEKVAVLSDSLWARRFGQQRSVLGQSIQLNGDQYTVIGVAPPHFAFPEACELWTPLVLTPGEYQNAGARYLNLVARLTPTATINNANAQLRSVSNGLAERFAATNRGWQMTSVSLHEQIVGPAETPLFILLGAVLLVLLVACGNVANLLFARAAQRRAESALRTALGASRYTLVLQFTAEVLVLFVLGGAAGLLIASWLIEPARMLLPPGLPRTTDLSMDLAVVLFTLGIAIGTGLLFGLSSAIRFANVEISTTLRRSGRGALGPVAGGRVTRTLVVTQIVLAVVLLVASSLLMATVAQLNRVNPGFHPEGVLTMQLFLSETQYQRPQAMAAFVEKVSERIQALPGVKSVGATTFLPMTGSHLSFPVLAAGRPPSPQPDIAAFNAVTPQYFTTLGIHLKRGRMFTPRDNQDAPRVTIVNERLARQLWPGEDPIGKKVTIFNAPPVEREVVGVVGDVLFSQLDGKNGPEIYEPYLQYPWRPVGLAIRSSGSPERVSESAIVEIRAMNPGLPIAKVQTMEQIVSRSIGTQRFMAWILSTFGVLALVLMSVGLYGLVSCWATERFQEFGVRMAMGATSGDILAMVAREGSIVVGSGLVVGLFGVISLHKLLGTILFNVSPLDPRILATVCVVIGLVALATILAPALRASRVAPSTALRLE
ncbi:MAG: ABC transporter permease [Bryobacterales bacterium]|nr:ABC transporter permease [Bryobacterales bacterium]